MLPHAFAIHDDPLHQERQVCCLLRTAEYLGQANRHVAVTSMRCYQQGMPLGIMEHHSFAAPQNFSTELAHRSSRDEPITVHRLAMTIHGKDGGGCGLIGRELCCLPPFPGPLCHHFCRSCMGQAREKPFSGALTASPCSHGQHRPVRASQIPGPGQTSHGEEQEGEEQMYDHHWIGWVQPRDGEISSLHDRCNQNIKPSRLLSRSQEQHAANSFLPGRLLSIPFCFSRACCEFFGRNGYDTLERVKEEPSPVMEAMKNGPLSPRT